MWLPSGDAPSRKPAGRLAGAAHVRRVLSFRRCASRAAGRLRIDAASRTTSWHWRTLIAEVDAVSERLGRVPDGPDELAKVRGRSLPQVPWAHSGRDSICHHAIGADRFLLYCFMDGEGMYFYDMQRRNEVGITPGSCHGDLAVRRPIGELTFCWYGHLG